MSKRIRENVALLSVNSYGLPEFTLNENAATRLRVLDQQILARAVDFPDGPRRGITLNVQLVRTISGGRSQHDWEERDGRSTIERSDERFTPRLHLLDENLLIPVPPRIGAG